MPVTHSAEKKERKDKNRTKFNKKRIELTKKLIKEAKNNPRDEKIKKAQSAIDKLAKVNVIHKNKAARLKSQLTKFKTQKKDQDVKKTSIKKVKKQKAIRQLADKNTKQK